MADLITTARALYNLDNYSASAAETTTLEAIIDAVTALIQDYCNRKFVSTSRDELFNGTQNQKLLLTDYPIISVDKVLFNPAPVLKVRNTKTTNQRARVRVDIPNDYFVLTQTASGTTQTDNVALSGNGTIGTLAGTIEGQASGGWEAEAASSAYEDFDTADTLAHVQGSFDALNTWAEIYAHVEELDNYDIDTNKGILIRRDSYSGNYFLKSGGCYGWEGGINYWRVKYTSGYSTVPEDIQEACAEWVAARFWQTKRDPGLAQDWVPGVANRTPVQQMPKKVKEILDRYRRHPMSHLRG